MIIILNDIHEPTRGNHIWSCFVVFILLLFKLYTGLQKYSSFCTQARKKAIPSENILLLSITYLAGQNLSSSSIQVYLSAVCYAHIAKGQHSQFKNQLIPQSLSEFTEYNLLLSLQEHTNL